jgi:hypothetical protein
MIRQTFKLTEINGRGLAANSEPAQISRQVKRRVAARLRNQGLPLGIYQKMRMRWAGGDISSLFFVREGKDALWWRLPVSLKGLTSVQDCMTRQRLPAEEKRGALCAVSLAVVSIVAGWHVAMAWFV